MSALSLSGAEVMRGQVTGWGWGLRVGPGPDTPLPPLPPSRPQGMCECLGAGYGLQYRCEWLTTAEGQEGNQE